MLRNSLSRLFLSVWIHFFGTRMTQMRQINTDFHAALQHKSDMLWLRFRNTEIITDAKCCEAV